MRLHTIVGAGAAKSDRRRQHHEAASLPGGELRAIGATTLD